MLIAKIKNIYRSLFSISEIESSSALQLVSLASAFVFFISFHSWMMQDTVTIENAASGLHICWPHFLNCGDWYFLSMLPQGYSQNIFYMAMFIVISIAVLGFYNKKWTLVHLCLLILFIWEFLFIFVLNISKRGNYDYYQIILTGIWLFLPYKFEFLRIIFCFLYFLASTIKINDGWILGSYFTSMDLGMPIFPAESTPFFTNSVIFMEMIGCWFLLSHNKKFKNLALIFFVIFHLYSGIIVWYRYPATILPYLLILFLPDYPRTIPLGRKSLPGWSLALMLLLFQSIPLMIPGDSRMTFEGINYGFYMFDSNHQCASFMKGHFKDGRVATDVDEKISARSRCDPYYKLFKILQLCKRDAANLEKVEWQFFHSINGGPFYLIVDEKNACELDYKLFRHNDWIKTAEDGAKIIGYPVKNVYY